MLHPALSSHAATLLTGYASRNVPSQFGMCMSRLLSTSSAMHAANDPSMSMLQVIGLVAHPATVGAAALETAHSTTGLPWWASIPVTALLARIALLPLSLKARQASTNWQLLNTAVVQARTLTLNMNERETRSLGRVELIKALYRHLQKKHKVPSLRWYWANGAAQALVLFTFTSALNHMSTAVWQGFTTGGPPGLRDLTSPPVFLETWSTPFGTLGAVVPLAIILAYVRALDTSRSAQVPGIGAALRILAVPLYVLSLLQPHSTLLYWMTHTLASVLIQSAPATAKAAIQEGSTCNVMTLMSLGRHYSNLKDSPASATAAVVCYQQAVQALQAELGARSQELIKQREQAAEEAAGASVQGLSMAGTGESTGEGEGARGGEGTRGGEGGKGGGGQAQVGSMVPEEQGVVSGAQVVNERNGAVEDGVYNGYDEELDADVGLLEEAQRELDAALARQARWDQEKATVSSSSSSSSDSSNNKSPRSSAS